MSDKADIKKPIMVIGLGRFGSAVANSLLRMGHEVMGVDSDPGCVQAMAGSLTSVIEADTTDIEVLRRLGMEDFGAAVVGIGSDIEASVLTVLALSDLGVTSIWAKAVNDNHGRILERTGATNIVYPEARMGERVAHILTGQMIDFIEFDDEFAIAKMRAPTAIVDRTLEESGVREKFGVTVVGVKRPQADFVYAVPDTVVLADDLMIVSGTTAQVERFAATAKR
ncbi:Ktr system potassium uptake protein [Alteripontixanthobacter maritimus]|uniref:Ktr system potassium uptake protein n=1 Tax=Alteripontixanthobacter maritimus TaxID=2161824 RepID=A0A369Q688_9SPHN|nr:TrkA family potassium uptake protein [Alteripontixanthobacter maritimus]RDC59025.1 Ktr system potassium uptake protein [Alteripontixanthobacter maritimus]